MTSRRSLPPGSRGLRLSAAPSVSIVVASSGAVPELRACLQALVPPCQVRGIEVVVARACSTAEFRDLQREWPQALWMPAPDGATRGAVRAAGLSAAEGDVVALIDDAIPRGDAWVAGLTDASRRAAAPA